MEVGTVSHKYYLVNIRLPVYERKKVNLDIGEIRDIHLVVRLHCSTFLLHVHVLSSFHTVPPHDPMIFLSFLSMLLMVFYVLRIKKNHFTETACTLF